MYHTSDLRSDLIGTPYCVPSTLPNLIQPAGQFSLTVATTSSGSGRTSPGPRERRRGSPAAGTRRCRVGVPPPTCVPMSSSNVAGADVVDRHPVGVGELVERGDLASPSVLPGGLDADHRHRRCRRGRRLRCRCRRRCRPGSGAAAFRRAARRCSVPAGSVPAAAVSVGSRGVRAGAGDARGAEHSNNRQRYEQRPDP